jgi:hypothetical protein
MARKTRKQTAKKRHLQGIKTIPELRQSFDYIDEFVKQRVLSGIPKEQLVKEIQTEWYRVFGKRIQKKNATAFAEHLLQKMKGSRSLRTMTRKTRGGAAPFMDPTTQAGRYLASGQIPTSSGQYPMADGSPSVYGSLTQYIHKGFEHPEIAAKGAYESPMPSAHMGSNRALIGGGRPLGGGRKKGGAILDSLRNSITQAIARPIPSDAPPSVLQTAQSAWNGRPIGLSPNPVEHPNNYALKDSMFPKMVNVRIDV